MQVHFQNLPHVIEHAIRSARKEIKIAVCWFTHPGIFEAVLYQCRLGIPVLIIINYDQLNIQPEGRIDFQVFIRAGGLFYGYTLPELMHHKFCIIDQQLVINGSFNWTQNNNQENILLTKQPEVVHAFLREFELLCAVSRYFKKIDFLSVKLFQSLQLLEVAEYSELTLRKKIAQGSQVWIYRTVKDSVIQEEMPPAGLIGFKNKVLMSQFWEENLYFQKENFSYFIKKSQIKVIEKASCRTWCLRLKQGDLVVRCDRQSRTILSFGIVQSVPFLYRNFYTGREVIWVKDYSQVPLEAEFKIPAAALSLYKGSSFELVARLCNSSLITHLFITHVFYFF